LKHGDKFKVSKTFSKTTVYIDEKIKGKEFFAKSKKWADKIAKVV